MPINISNKMQLITELFRSQEALYHADAHISAGTVAFGVSCPLRELSLSRVCFKFLSSMLPYITVIS